MSRKRFTRVPAPVPHALAALLVLAAFVGRAAADGCMIPPYWRDIEEPDQIALLVHDEAAGREDLYLQVSFHGNAEEFAWIVPVPAVPELDEVGSRLFYECSDLTRPIGGRKRGVDFGCGSRYAVNSPGDSEVEIIAEETVGIYETMTLGASDAGALVDSLTAWGYLQGEGEGEAEVLEAFQFYVDKGWFFVVMRIDDAEVGEPGGDGYWYGGIDPIRLSFASAQPVYPLRISALSAGYGSRLLLYVCSDHRMSFEEASTEYANRISSNEHEAIARRFPELGQILPSGSFLTKLRRFYTADEMTGDLVLEQAPSDEEFRLARYSSVLPGLPGGDLLLIGALLLLVGLGAIRVRARQRVPARARS